MQKPRLNVLLIDDDLVDRMACRYAFARNQEIEFVLTEAESGEEGLRCALASRPDCILLDFNLPDLDGLEFLARLSESSRNAVPPVMLLTGGDSAVVAAEAIKRGARHYMNKDVGRNYLALLPDAIQAMLREHQLMEEKRLAEAKFRKLVEQIQAIIYIAALGEGGKLIYISPQIGALGFTPQEWLDDPALSEAQIHADDRALALDAIAKCRLHGTPMRQEYRLLTRGGRVLWFRDEAEQVVDENGRGLFVQGILVNITQNKLAEEALKQSQAELRRLAAHQEQVKEEERKRIAREIHDELGSQLTSIKAYVSVSVEHARSRGEEPDPLLIDAAEVANAAIETVRRVITDLRPSVLDQLGIWAAIEWYAQRIEKMADLICVCRIDEALTDIEVNPEQSTMLFRVVQEALTNVVRHAGASLIEVGVRLQGGKIVVEIVDDGKGIDTERLLNRESMGILGMYERTRHHGGELKISGSPGRGTSVVLRLSLGDRHEP
jgi:two-component system sensor histidine kinase UhpB